MVINNYNTTYIVSDLHLAEGNLAKGKTLGTENFFSDNDFDLFLNHLLAIHPKEKLHLIINGDFVDFIRITEYPKNSELDTWIKEVKKTNSKVEINASHISDKERKYGLKTNDYKSIWKLYLSIKGHLGLFQSLAKWLCLGHQLTIVVGNHDPEWHWVQLQEYLKIRLYEIAVSSQSKTSINKDDFIGNNFIHFVDDFICINKTVRIEHGHNYNKMTSICKDFELRKCKKIRSPWYLPEKIFEKELALPMGSFFNRYLINKVEIIFPYVDNLTGNKALFNAIIEEDFGSAFKILYLYLGYTLKIILKYFWRSIGELFIYLSVTVLPIALIAYLSYSSLSREGPLFDNLPGWLSMVLEQLRNFSPIVLRYVLQVILKYFNLEDKPLSKSIEFDMQKGQKLSDYEIIFVGHNHTPEYINFDNNKTYVNTGTWTDKYVFKYKHIQAGNKFAVGKLHYTDNLNPEAELLQWIPQKNILLPLTSFKSQ